MFRSIDNKNVNYPGSVSYYTNLLTPSTSPTSAAIVWKGGLSINNATDASSSTNGGSFTSAGGGAFAKKLYVGGTFYAADATASSSSSTGCALFAGGIGVANSTDSTSSTNGGSFTSAGGGAFAKTLYANKLHATSTEASTGQNTGAIQSEGGITCNNNGDATSSTNGGAITSWGGIACRKTLYVGTAAICTATTASSSTTTGAIRTAGGFASSNTTDATSSTNGGSCTLGGGLAVGKKLYVGTGVYLPTATGTSTELNYYEEATVSLTFNTYPDTTKVGTTTGRFVRIGKQVTLFIDAFTLTGTVPAGTTAVYSTNILPTRLSITGESTWLCKLLYSSTFYTGFAIISGGAISINLDTSLGAMSLPLLVLGNSVSWSLN